MNTQKIKEALETGLEAAEELAAITHQQLAGFQPHKHAAADADVRQIKDALAALSMPQEAGHIRDAAKMVSRDDGRLVPKWEGEFKTFSQWVSHAQDALSSPNHYPAVCIDAIGRRCTIGKDFMTARDEGTFPIRYFWEFESIAAIAKDKP
jgi:hypothetical protein